MGALRAALSDKDVEIDRLRAENIERLAMPPPQQSSTPSSVASFSLNLKSSKRKLKGLGKTPKNNQARIFGANFEMWLKNWRNLIKFGSSSQEFWANFGEMWLKN
mgnify:CR=1 FL=1